MHPDHPQTPSVIIGGLLTHHPEAVSLQAEACHCRALARSSAANARQTFAAQQAARFAYEELRHQLDPRRRRTVAFGTGLLVIALLGTGLMVMDFIELSGMLGRTSTLLLALVAAVVWLTGAWMAALASWERSWPMLLAAGITGAVLGLLLAAVHALSHRGTVLGVLVSVCILVLASGAARLIARMESAELYAARRSWQRARNAYATATRAEHNDVETATVATESWLGLVRTWVSGVAHDERLVPQTVGLAVALLEADSADSPEAPDGPKRTLRGRSTRGTCVLSRPNVNICPGAREQQRVRDA